MSDNAQTDVPDTLFSSIQYYVTGEIPDQIIDLLKSGGAQRSNYFSDYVTHLICGLQPEENDISDATDVYEIPAVTPEWVRMCSKLKRLTTTKPYQYSTQNLFSNLTFCLNKLGLKDTNLLWALIKFFGGNVQLNFNRNCTHLVTVRTNSQFYEKAAGKAAICTPDWILECVKQKTLVAIDAFHPTLIDWSKLPAAMESTTAITGFEPENQAPSAKEPTADVVVDSTQALLDKLKQRMPWNQSATANNVTASSEIVPPNVVAPSFKQQQQQVQTNQIQQQQIHPPFMQQGQIQQVVQQQQQIPRSIVHHQPQQAQLVQQQAQIPQQQQAQLQQNFQINNPQQQMQNRMVGQQPPRPNIQHLRAQLSSNQLHHQLLQQRLAQQQQQQQNLQQGTPAQGPRPPLTLQQQQMLQQQLQNRQILQQQQQIGQPQVVQQQQAQFLPQQQQIFKPQQPFQQQPGQFNQQPPPELQQQNIWPQQVQTRPSGPAPPQIQQQQRHQLIQGNVQQTTRLQWSPNQLQQRQFIHLDAQTHNELQKMPPEQQALFVAKIKHKQLMMQKQLQQRAAAGGQQQPPQQQQQQASQIFIRGSVPPGLSPQQQMQWLQQQAKQQGVVLPPNIQQQGLITTAAANAVPQSPTGLTPGLSPIQQQQTVQFGSGGTDQNQLRQFRLQQLQLQREQAAQKMQQQQLIGQPQTAPIPQQQVQNNDGQQLVVNAKTKTALANMLSIRLQSGNQLVADQGTIDAQQPQQPSAAGTLRLMTQQHNAALNNNNNRDLLAMQQQQQQQQRQRLLNSTTNVEIRPPGQLQPQQQQQQQTQQIVEPKVTYSPRPTSLVPLQHRPGPFYGHNPNLKLPPDLFLLGCIFVVVEIERYLDESLPGWQKKIEKHGGEIEKQYCNRVTHVLCETQRHGVVMQALRDCKRCITIYWLSDVMKRKQVLPPWTALHLPAIYLDLTPAAKHLIALSGFSGSERFRVKHMISYTGAKFTPYFSKHNTLLISAKQDGPKYGHAKKWGTPIVNVQWLTDVMLGNFTALNQMEHIVYQQFTMPPNFSFDPKLVPNLMHAWKMPINISQESYERVKRSASPVLMPKKAKKFKLEENDENEPNNVNTVATLTSNELTEFPNVNYKILFSQTPNTDELKKIVKQLNGMLAQNAKDCTHLVMSTLTRTNKLLQCVCREVKIHVMPEQWLKDSQQAEKFLDESNYVLDAKEFNNEYKCDFYQTLQMKNRNGLFVGKYFWITPSVYPSKRFLSDLIEQCGGMVEKIRRSVQQIEVSNLNAPFSYIIITHENDIHLVGDLLKNKKNFGIVCNVELIFTAILKQSFEIEPFAVKVM